MIHSKNEAHNGLKVMREIPPKPSSSFSATANSSGFTLIEVLLSIALVAIVLGPIYILQHTIFNNTVRATDAVDRMFIAYSFLLDAQKQKAAGAQQKKITKTIADPKTELKYEIKELGGDSSLSKRFNHLYVEQVSYNWSTLGLPYSDAYALIVFEPPQEKEEGESKGQKAPEQPKPAAKQNGANNKKTQTGGARL